MRIVARYPGRCCACRGPIEVGAEIEWDTAGRRGRHAGCPAPTVLPGVPAVVPTEWFRDRWKHAERTTPEVLPQIAWTVAIHARKDSREIVDCGTALLAAPDLYLVHGGYAPAYGFTHAVLRGGAAAYLAAVSAAIPDDGWPLEGELCAGGYCLWRTYPSCLLTGPAFNGTIEYL
jgi:hypothetical protein